MLQVEVVVLHVRSANIRINHEGIAFQVAATGRSKHGLIVKDASGHAGGNNLCGADRVVSRTGIIEGRIWQMSKERILGESVIENSPPGTDNRCAFSRGIPGEA